MKSILISLFLLLSLFKSNNKTNGPIGKYRVEFYNVHDESYIITFREKDYFKTNFKGETIGKGRITKYLRKNGEGIVHLNDYIINIPAGKIDKIEHVSLQTDYTEFWFTEKDTIQFGIHRQNNAHVSFKTGRMIRITK